MSTFRILLTPGDGIGPEVIEEATKVLGKVQSKFNHEFQYEEETIGGYVFRLLGQKPMVGDQVKVGKWDVTVTETQGFRVVRLQVLPTDEPEVLLETEE